MEFGYGQGATGPDSRQGFVQSRPLLFLNVDRHPGDPGHLDP
ncbi:hypothetical protein [Arthrobacter sp. ok362]|nr:hypothetical protein [Arthrobacter sp. ok362]